MNGLNILLCKCQASLKSLDINNVKINRDSLANISFEHLETLKLDYCEFTGNGLNILLSKCQETLKYLDIYSILASTLKAKKQLKD